MCPSTRVYFHLLLECFSCGSCFLLQLKPKFTSQALHQHTVHSANRHTCIDELVFFFQNSAKVFATQYDAFIPARNYILLMANIVRACCFALFSFKIIFCAVCICVKLRFVYRINWSSTIFGPFHSLLQTNLWARIYVDNVTQYMCNQVQKPYNSNILFCGQTA